MNFCPMCVIDVPGHRCPRCGTTFPSARATELPRLGPMLHRLPPPPVAEPVDDRPAGPFDGAVMDACRDYLRRRNK